MGESQFEYGQHMQLIIDCVPGNGGMFRSNLAHRSAYASNHDARLRTRTRRSRAAIVGMAALRHAEDGRTHHHPYCDFIRSCPIAATTACSQSLRPATD